MTNSFVHYMFDLLLSPSWTLSITCSAPDQHCPQGILGPGNRLGVAGPPYPPLHIAKAKLHRLDGEEIRLAGLASPKSAFVRRGMGRHRLKSFSQSRSRRLA